MVNIVPVLIIGALIWWFFRRKRKNTMQAGGRSAPILMDSKHNVYITPLSQDEERVAELHRKATQFKDAKDWDSAIRCLEEAKTLSQNILVGQSLKQYLRLPLFLQQGGYFEASMTEFQNILAKIEQRTEKEFSHQSKSVQKMLAHADYSQIYAAMSTACKREKKMEMQEEFQTLSKEHKEKHAKLLKADNAREAKRLAERKKR